MALHKHLVSVVVQKLSTFAILALSTLAPMFQNFSFIVLAVMQDKQAREASFSLKILLWYLSKAAQLLRVKNGSGKVPNDPIPQRGFNTEASFCPKHLRPSS